GRDVAYGKNIRDIGLRFVVFNAALCERNRKTFVPQAFEVRGTSHCYQRLFYIEPGLRAIVVFQFVFYPAVFYLHADQPRIPVDEDPVVLHVAFDDLYNIRIFKRQDTVTFVNEIYFCSSESGEDRGEFTTDDPGTYNHHTFG